MPSSKSLEQALADFRRHLAKKGYVDLRDAFAHYADSNGDDLAGDVIGFVRARGVYVPGYQVVCHLLGVGPNRFHQYLIDRLSGDVFDMGRSLVPVTRHRIPLGGGRLEVLRMTVSLDEEMTARELILSAHRIVHFLVNDLFRRGTTPPGRVGILRDPFGVSADDPASVWTYAVGDFADTAQLRCDDIEAGAQSLGAYALDEWAEPVIAGMLPQAEVMLHEEEARARAAHADLQGPPEPRRIMVSAELDELFTMDE